MAFENIGHGTAVFDEADQVLSGKYFIKKAMWTEFSATTDTLSITDATGQDILTMNPGATSGEEEIKVLNRRWVEDLKVSEITHGKLYVYYG